MAGETVLELNDFFKEHYLGSIAPLSVYKIPMLELSKREWKKEGIGAYVGGKGITATLMTQQPMNAQPRGEGEDWPTGGKHLFKPLSIYTSSIAASEWLGKEEREEAEARGQDNLPKIKLRSLREGLSARMDNDCMSDGTGRLARVSATATVTYLGETTVRRLTVDNTAYDFGWDDIDMCLVGQYVDVFTPADGTSNWATQIRNGKIIGLDKTNKYVYISTAECPTADTVDSEAADGDYIFMRNSVKLASINGALTRYQGIRGIHYLADDGTTNYTSGGSGSYIADEYYGLQRSLYSTLKAKITTFWSGTSAGDWTIDDVLDNFDTVMYADRDNSIDFLFANPKWLRALKRRATSEGNISIHPTSREVVAGMSCRQLDYDGQLITIVPMRKMVASTVIAGNRKHLHHFAPHDVRPYNPYTGQSNGDPWFGAVGKREGSLEAWYEANLQLYAERCDNLLVLKGMRTDI